MSDFNLRTLKDQIAALAARGVFLGTSSWKYVGWTETIYDEQRYIYRGKWSKKRLEDNCLSEYASIFKSVCVDAAYYQFFDERYIAGLVSQVPQDFLFSWKVTEEITVKRFPIVEKHGARGGQLNEHFLNADRFASAFVKPFEQFRQNVGMFIFEFSQFSREDYQNVGEFIIDLDRFLGNIPKGWRYGVEIRNEDFLRPEYFSMLSKHGVSHVYNSWTAMPPVGEQLARAGSITTPNFSGARFLLKPGRNYKQAVKAFEPYKHTQEVYEDARRAAAELIRRRLRDKAIQLLFIYINNRLEGNAPMTIWAILESLGEV
jgi:uncharacterized protein YecE (DUF72 family)